MTKSGLETPTRLLPESAASEGARAHVSVIILSFNEEANLPDCLASLQDLDCRVFVVDSYSTDKTPEIARAHGVAFTQHVFENYAAQRNWALHQLSIETPPLSEASAFDVGTGIE